MTDITAPRHDGLWTYPEFLCQVRPVLAGDPGLAALEAAVEDGEVGEVESWFRQHTKLAPQGLRTKTVAGVPLRFDEIVVAGDPSMPHPRVLCCRRVGDLFLYRELIAAAVEQEFTSADSPLTLAEKAESQPEIGWYLWDFTRYPVRR